MTQVHPTYDELEQRCRVAESRYQLLVEQSPAVVYVDEIGGHWQFISQQLEKVTGYTPEELIQQRGLWKRIVHPDDLPRLEAETQAGIEKGKKFVVEYRLIARDGRIVWIHDEANVFCDPKTGKVFLSGVLQDITHLKQAEAAARLAGERLQQVMNQVKDIVWLASIDGREIIDINERFEEVYGIPCRDIEANSQIWLQSVHPDDYELALESHRKLFSDDHSEAEYRICRPNGTIRWILDRKTILKDEQGVPAQIGGVATDITERRLSEEKLRESEEKYRSLIESQDAAISTIDRDGVFQYVNVIGAAPFGAPQDLVGRKVTDIFSPPVAEWYLAQIHQVFDTGQGILAEYLANLRGRPSWRQVSIQPIHSQDGSISLVTVNSVDISAQKDNEAALLKSEALLKEAQRIGRIGHVEWNAGDEGAVCSDEIYNILEIPRDGPPFSKEVVMSLLPRVEQDRMAVQEAETTVPITEIDTEYPIELRGGRKRWVHQVGHISYDEDGRPVYMMSILQDVTDRKHTEELIAAQRDLASLAGVQMPEEQIWKTCMQTALRVSGMDCGGLYLLDELSGVFELVYHEGLSKDFVKRFGRFTAETPSAKMIMLGRSSFFSEADPGVQGAHLKEGLHSGAMLPIQDEGRVIGCMNIASHVFANIPVYSQKALETITGEIANIIIRVRTETALQASREQLRQALLTARMGTWQYHIPTDRFHWSPEAGSLFGVETGWNDLNSVLQHFHPHDVEGVVAAMRALLEKKEVLHLEYRIFDASGNIRWFTNYGHVECDKEGHPVSIQGLIQDITERKNAERALIDSEELHRLTLTFISDAVFITDADGRFTFVGANVGIIFGYTYPEVAEMKSIDRLLGGSIFDPAELDGTGEISNIERVIVDKSGHEHVLLVTVKRISLNGGTVLYTCHDISERRQAEMELRESEERFRSFIEQSSDGFSLADETGRIIEWNRALAGISGIDREQAIGRYLWDLQFQMLTPELRPQISMESLKLIFHEMLDDSAVVLGRATDVEIYTLRQERKFIQQTAFPIRTLKGYRVGSVVRDITERKRMEADLRNALFTLESAEEQVGLASWSIDVETGKGWWSRHMYRMFGLSPESGVPTTEEYLELIHPDDRLMLATTMAQLTSGGQPERSEFRTNPERIEPRILSPNYHVEKDEYGRALRFYGTTLDLTQTRMAEQARWESDERYHLLFETMQQGVIFQDRDGQIIQANPAAERILGLDNSEILGRSSTDPRWFSIHEDFTSFAGEDHPAMVALQTGKLVSNVVMGVFNPMTDSYRWININAVPRFRSGEEKPYQVCTTFEDITERKQAEARLSFQASLLDQVHNGVIVIDFMNSILYWNNFAEELYQWTGSEAVGRNMVELLAPQGMAEMFNHTLANLHRQGYWEGELDLKRKDGSILPIYLVNTYLKDAGGKSIGFICISMDISERRRAAETVRVALTKFETLFESFPLGISITDESGNIIEANPIAEELLGVSRSEHTHRKIDDVEWKLIRPDGTPMPAGEYASVQALKEGQKVDNVEMGICKPGEEVTWLNVTAAPLPLDGYGVVITYGDITGRKQADQKLRESERKYRDLINGMNDTVWVIDFDMSILDVNTTASSVLGYSRAELLSMKISDIDTVLTVEQIQGLIDSLPQDVAQVFETQHRAKDGRIVPVEVSSGLVSYAGHTTIMSIARDITERKQAEQALQEAEFKYRTLAENSPDTIYIIDLVHFMTIYLNRETLLGYTLQELEASGSLLSKVHPDDLPAVQANWQRCLQGVNDEPVEYRLKLKDGTWEWLNSRSRTLVVNAAGKPEQLLVTLSVITERRNAEEALTRSQALLTEAQRIGRIGYMEWNGVGQPLVCSEVVYEILGLSRDEVINQQTFVNMMLPEERERIRQMELLFLEQKKNTDYEYRMRTMSGREIWLHQMGSVTYDRNGSPVRMMATIQDVTERRLVEETLRESEERFRSLFESSQAIMLLIDPDSGAIVDANFAAADFYGYPRKQLASMNVGEINQLPAEDVFTERQKAKREERNFFIFPHRLANGQVRMVEVRSHPIHSNKQVLLFSLIYDVTESLQNQKSLHDSQLRMEMALKGANVATWDWNVQTGETVFNERWAAIIGHTLQELEPISIKTWEELCHSEDLNVSNELLRRHFAGETEFYECEVRMKHKDGSWVWVIDRGRVMEWDSDGKPLRMFGTHLDITERKREERYTAARLRLADFSSESPDVDMLVRTMLDEAEALTDSSIGFFHFVDDDQNTIHLQTWSTNTLQNMCTAEGKGQHYPVDQAGVWAESIRDGEPHIYNDYPGLAQRRKLPQGHAPVIRLISLPIKRNNKVVAVLGVGNKQWIYDERDLAIVKHLAEDTFDIILRKRAEEARRASEEKYRGLLESLDSIVITVDRQGRVLYVNEPAARQLRHTSDEVIGRTMHDLFPPQAADIQMKDIQIVMDRNQGATFENPITVNDQVRWYHTSIQPLHDDAGQITSVLINSTDIHDLKAAQQELQDLNRTLEERVRERTAEVQDLYDNAPVGYHSIDANRNVVSINQTELAMLGYTHDEVVGKHNSNFFTRESEKTLADGFDALVVNGKKVDMEVMARRKDGTTFPALINAIAVYDEKGGLLHSRSTFTDITERKRAEDALHNAIVELERALRVKDEFLANMSHELRTPLNAIIGLSESLSDQIAGELNDKQQKYINTIRESGQHLLTLINDILDLSKIEAGQVKLDPSRVNIQVVCEASLRMIKQLALKKNLQVKFEMEDQVSSLQADERRLKQMLVNLLTNAVKFTPERGEIGLQVQADRARQEICFTVWDHGIGIKPEEQARLFMPFVQVNTTLTNTLGGTGLGLALVRQLAHLHHGRIELQSEYGVGSRFILVLPGDVTVPEDVAPIDSSLPVPMAADEKKEPGVKTILLVEDTESVIMVIHDYLEYAGYHVEVAHNGIEGIELAKQLRPALILMDIQMPGMDGLAATRVLRSMDEFRAIPIVALTAFAMRGDRERFLAAGMSDYISKPVSLKTLTNVVAMYIDRDQEHPG
jgi:PAS domain S-box-containing protein